MHDSDSSVGAFDHRIPQDVRRIADGLTGIDWSVPDTFDQALSTVAAFQAEHVDAYARYCDALGLDAAKAPPIPIEVFKRAVVSICGTDSEAVFMSSGTTASGKSRHYVCSLLLYEQSFKYHFHSIFGAGPFTFVAHLPQYEAAGDRSSLLYMVRGLIDEYGDEASGFFLEEHDLLIRAIEHSRRTGHPLVLFGAAFGLLDLIEDVTLELPSSALVVETGGMKTYRREISRRDLHSRLSAGFRVAPERIWSEYGMCELLSQCYMRGVGVFRPPPWMRFEIRDSDNPMRRVSEGEAGLLAVSDLANVYSVSSILTEDLAVKKGPGFAILGRLSGSDLRGCNLLLESIAS